MKKLYQALIGITSLLMCSTLALGQPISQNFYGQSYWYSKFNDINAPQAFSTGVGSVAAKVKSSGVKLMRIGGHDYNFLNDNKTASLEAYPFMSAGVFWPAGYVQMVDNVRAMGFEPMITLPFTPIQANLNQQITLSDNNQVNTDIIKWAKAAYDIVYSVNVIHGRNVKYFVIANEPDNSWSFNYTTASQIQHYFKDIAVMAKLADKNIQIIGPELASYNSTICTALLGGTNTISDAIPSSYTDVAGNTINTSALSGKYFLDIFTVHHYSWGGGSHATSDAQIITNLRGGFANTLQSLVNKVTTANGSRTSPIKIGITEANIEYDNASTTGSWGANSFIGGQFWAELMSICMEKGVEIFCPWSVVEGTGPTTLNIGYLDESSTKFEKPSYWHYSMIANNFSGNYLPEVSTKALNTDFKAFASQDGDHVAVMILSQKTGSSTRPYTVNLNGGTSSVIGDFCFNAGISNTHTGNIDDQSTLLLIFDCSGSLIKSYKYRNSVEWAAKSAPLPTGSYNAITAAGSNNSCRYTASLGNDVTGNLSVNTSGLTYAWTGPNGYTSNVQNPSNAIFPGTYTVVISGLTSPCGSVTRTAFLGKLSAIVDAGADKLICTPGNQQIGSIPITYPGTQTYQWTIPPGTSLTSSSNSQPYATISSSSKSLMVRAYMAGNVCPARDFVVISAVYSGSSFSYPASNICASSTSPVSPIIATNSTKGNFTSSPVLSSLNALTGVLSPPFPSSGTYVITNAVSNSCGSTSSNASITFNSGGVTANAGADVSMYPECITTLNGTSAPALAPSSYNWFAQGSSVPVSPGGNPVIVSPGTTTTYLFEANNGTCKSYDDKKVTILTSPLIHCYRPYPYGYASAICGNPNGDPNKDYAGNLNSDLRVTNDTAWITSDITVHNNSTLEFANTIVIISPNVKITVQPGGKLIIDRSSLQTCDGSNWGGIFVMGNNNDAGQLSVTSSLLTNAKNVITTVKAVDVKVVGNLFLAGEVALSLDRNTGFDITENEFFSYDIGVKTTKTASGTSYISKNTFGAVRTAISFDGDDHSKLLIACNTFEYKDYGIRSDKTILKDQGTSIEGAGNVFISTSTLPTNKLRHTNGNPVVYYYDPSNPLASSDMNTSLAASLSDATCAINTRMAHSATSEESAKTVNNNFRIYPNPSNGTLKLDYLLNPGENGVMAIYDIAGRRVSEYPLSQEHNSISIIENGLKDGIYFYYIWVNGKIASSNKLVIIK